MLILYNTLDTFYNTLISYNIIYNTLIKIKRLILKLFPVTWFIRIKIIYYKFQKVLFLRTKTVSNKKTFEKPSIENLGFKG